MKILSEASGSLASSYLLKAIKESGNTAISSDIIMDIAGRFLAKEFILMPKKDKTNLWDFIEKELIEREVNCVIPSLDETLIGWAKRKEYFFEKKIHVILSNSNVIETFQDKWSTYTFFVENNIPTPKTSLTQDYTLIKPRFGRGSQGVFKTDQSVKMEGNISQVFIEGTEYTVDVFCDKFSNPVYIVPRKRLNVKDGKSTAGIVVNHPLIIKYVRQICASACFIGPINIQCFETKEGEIKFIEINPRIAGGMALGFAATENWVKLIVDHFIYGKDIEPVDVKYGLKMMRYYSEIFTF